jgi:anti-sigma B factor antagonist
VAVLPRRVDVSNAGPVRDELLTVINRGAAVLLVDMTATTSCDYAAADALMRVHQQAVAKGSELRLVVVAPVVRRVIAVSGLDRLVAVFPALEAAQAARPLPAVLPLPPAAASTSRAATAPRNGPRPVSHLPAADTASLVQDGRQGRHGQELQEALTRLTAGILDAGLALQTAIDRPPAALRQAIEHALDQLDGALRHARAIAFARNSHHAHGRADVKKPGTRARPRMQAGAAPMTVAGEETARLAELLARAARATRAESREVLARTLQVASLSALTQDRVAANLGQFAASYPHHSDQLRALSRAATGHAIRMRQWAQDHPVAG